MEIAMTPNPPPPPSGGLWSIVSTVAAAFAVGCVMALLMLRPWEGAGNSGNAPARPRFAPLPNGLAPPGGPPCVLALQGSPFCWLADGVEDGPEAIIRAAAAPVRDAASAPPGVFAVENGTPGFLVGSGAWGPQVLIAAGPAAGRLGYALPNSVQPAESGHPTPRPRPAEAATGRSRR
jgi:hypothetical protein